MVRLLPLAVSLLLIAVSRGADSLFPPRVLAPEKQLLQKSERLIIPRYSVKEVSLAEAVRELELRARRADPQRIGIPVIVGESIFKEPPTVSPTGETASYLLPSRDRKITLSLRNRSVAEIFGELRNVASCRSQVTASELQLIASSQEERHLPTQVVPLPTFLFGKDAAPEALGVNPAKIAKIRKEPQQFFEEEGVQFPAGAHCTYDGARLEIILQSTLEDIDFAISLLETLIPEPVPGPAVPKWGGDAPLENTGARRAPPPAIPALPEAPSVPGAPAPTVLVTKEWRIPPGLYEEQHPSAADDPSRKLEYQTASGVTFEAAPSAIYLPQSSRLIVKDTPARFDQIDEEVEIGWEKYYASEAWQKELRRQQRLRELSSGNKQRSRP